MKDFGLLLIKPDGVKKNIDKILENILEQRNIEIIEKKKLLLKKSDMQENFYYQLLTYQTYMCEGEIIVYLLMCVDFDIAYHIYTIKNSIRNMFNITNKETRNLIHGANNGMEFFRQRNLFFPEYRNIKYSSYADMLVLVNNYKEERSKLIHKIENSNLEKVCFVINENDFLRTKHQIITDFKNGNLKEFFFAILVDLELKNSKLQFICIPRKEDCINDSKNKIELVNGIDTISIILDFGKSIDYETYINYQANNFDEYKQYHIKKIQDDIIEQINWIQSYFNVEGIVTATSNMSIMEAESRFYVSKKLGLSAVIGSFNINNVGEFSIGKSNFDVIENLISK